MPDDEALVVQRSADPELDSKAAAAAAGLSSNPKEAIAAMEELSKDVKLGYAYKASLGACGVVPKLCAMLTNSDKELATAACALLYTLARHGANAEAVAAAGAVPTLLGMYNADSSFNIVMGGPAAGLLKRIAATSDALQAAVVKQGAMPALLTGFRDYPINDDVEESVPANATRTAIEKAVSAYEEAQAQLMAPA